MRVIALLLPFVIYLSADVDIDKIDSISNGLLADKSEVDLSYLDKISDPFYYKEVSGVKKEVEFDQPLQKSKKEIVLDAIFQNRAKINQKWYKLGDMIEGYELLEINEDHIIVQADEMKTIYIKGRRGDVFTTR